MYVKQTFAKIVQNMATQLQLGFHEARWPLNPVEFHFCLLHSISHTISNELGKIKLTFS
jgi:hypothetical protein